MKDNIMKSLKTATAAAATLWLLFVFYQWFSIHSNWIAVISIKYLHLPSFGGNFIYNILENILIITDAVLFIIPVYGYGRFCLLEIFKYKCAGSELFIFSSALGLAITGHLALILGVAQLLYPKAIIISILPGYMAAYLSTRTMPVHIGIKEAALSFKTADNFEKTLIACIIFFLCENMIFLFNPDIDTDTMNYTLAIPNFWLLNHGIQDMPQHIYFNLFSFYACIYAAAAGFGDLMTARMTNFFAVIVSSFGITSYLGKKYFNRKTVLLALTVICGSYSFMKLVTITESDSISLIFSMTAFIMLMGENIKDIKTVILSGIFAGCAMAAKPTCLFFIICSIAILVYRSKDEFKTGIYGFPKNLVKPLIFIFTASLPVIPWLVKNQLFRGNPFFPFLTGIFGTDSNYDPVLVDTFLQNSYFFRDCSFALVKNFLNLFISKENFLNEFIQPVLLAVSGFIPLLPFKTDKNKNIIIIFSVTVLILQLCFFSIARFYFSLYILFTLVFSYIFYPVIEKHGILKLFTLISVFIFSLPVITYGNWFDMFAIPYGRLSKTEYLREQPEYGLGYGKAAAWANKYLPADAKLLVNDSYGRSLYLERKLYATSFLDKMWYDIFADENTSAEEILNNLRKNGFTHLIENLGRGHLSDKLDPIRDERRSIIQRENIMNFRRKYLKPLYNSSEGYIYPHMKLTGYTPDIAAYSTAYLYSGTTVYQIMYPDESGTPSQMEITSD